MYKQNRLKFIDIAKGLAILCVVLGHVLAYDIYGFKYVWNNSPLLKFIYSFHMPLFFLLSGLVYSSPTEGIYKDMYKRCRTLIFPFIIVGALYSIVINNNLSFILSEYKSGYWYLLVLFYCYMFNYLLINKIDNKKLKLIFFIQVFIILFLWKLLFNISHNIPLYIQNILSINLLILYYPYFLIGSIIKRFSLYNVFFNKSYIFLTAVFIWIFNSNLLGLYYPYTNYIVTFSITIVVMNICYKITDSKMIGYKTLELLGLNSIYIYVFHYFALQLMKMPFFEQWLVSITPSVFLDLIISIIPTTFAVIFSIAIKCILEKQKNIMKIVFNK